MVLNSRVKSALSRKQEGITPVSDTDIKRHQTGIFNFNSIFFKENFITSQKYFERRLVLLVVIRC
jgi:hypothetical protein